MSTEPIFDLRSDTVTRPGRAMREAMANAPVGDDVYGEDPTVIALQERTAELLGKESALFVASGTMSNQIALLVHTRPGDEVVIGEGAHVAFYESGAGAALAGVQFAQAGAGGLFEADELSAVVKPRADYHPRSSLVCLENTHNRAGGRIFPQAKVEAVVKRAREHGLSAHLDGARLWHAALASGRSEAELARPFDTVSVCFSKGLGAPVGSALVGSRELLQAARRYRKMLGGGMRQAGILAAGALFALDQQRLRLHLDHEAARVLAGALAQLSGVELVTPETNIVSFTIAGLSAEQVVAAARARGVLVNATGPHSLRAVTHLDLSAGDVAQAAERLCDAIVAVAQARGAAP
ncbi:MAG TPA: GntG family PLP-dependent aldolase [Polyangiaceae bacterium]|nr:GntG family PLP-dependent aldolase [Polyangiaceae bacterium]